MPWILPCGHSLRPQSHCLLGNLRLKILWIDVLVRWSHLVDPSPSALCMPWCGGRLNAVQLCCRGARRVAQSARHPRWPWDEKCQSATRSSDSYLLGLLTCALLRQSSCRQPRGSPLPTSRGNRLVKILGVALEARRSHFEVVTGQNIAGHHFSLRHDSRGDLQVAALS